MSLAFRWSASIPRVSDKILFANHSTSAVIAGLQPILPKMQADRIVWSDPLHLPFLFPVLGIRGAEPRTFGPAIRSKDSLAFPDIH